MPDTSPAAPPPEPADWPGALWPVALEAAREIMAVYAGAFAAFDKADGSPVTAADQRAEAVILARLAALAPGIAAVAEEEMAAGRAPRLGDRFFLIDPLDGTKAFIARQAGEFTVNIALIAAGRPAAGVVYAPGGGDLFYGGPGLGAFRARCEPETARVIEPARAITVRPAPGGGLTALTSRSADTARLRQTFAAAGVAQWLGLSSSIKLCLLAAGEADLYPRLGPVNEWDIAAGHAVLAGAGGALVRPDGSDMAYGQKAPDFGVAGFVAYGAREAGALALAALK